MDTQTRFFSILATLVVMIAYANSFNASWHYDDFGGILKDSFQIRDLGTAIKNLPLKSRSVVDLSFSLNYQLDGYELLGYHFVNLLSHVCATIALYLLIMAFYRTPAGSDDATARHAFPVAACAALLFALHPVQTQAITYIVQRYTLFGTLFYFLTILYYLKQRMEGDGKRTFLYLSLFFALLAVHSKPNTATLPVAVVLADLLFFRAPVSRQMLARLAPYFLIVALVPLRLLLIAPLHDTGELYVSLPVTLREAGSWQGFLAHFHALWYYMRFMAWPTGLAIMHDFEPITTLLHPAVIGAYALAIAIVAASWRLRKGHPVIAFGLAFFLLAPMIELFWPDKMLFYDHWLYLASSGFILAFVGGFFALAVRCGLPVKGVGGLLAGLMALFLVATFVRNGAWKSEETIWQDAVQKSPASVEAHSNLGMVLAIGGRVEEGCRYIEQGYNIDPNNYSVLMNMGNCRKAMGDAYGAKKYFQAAEEVKPK